jgi:hypothetical protein
MVEFPFEGKIIVLRPMSDTLSASASAYYSDGTTFEIGVSTVHRFLSRLAWTQNAGIEELFVGAGTNNTQEPGRLGRGSYGVSGWGQIDPWHYVYLPRAEDPKADLALALYREGMSINSPPFAFLSFFKVLNIVHAAGNRQMDWINANLHLINDYHSIQRLAELQQTHLNIGNYLYVQGRCATAHANGSPIANPDNYTDRRRLEQDLPLIKDLAALFIETVLGVERSDTFIRRRHNDQDDLPELYMQGGRIGEKIIYVPFARKRTVNE